MLASTASAALSRSDPPIPQRLVPVGWRAATLCLAEATVGGTPRHNEKHTVPCAMAHCAAESGTVCLMGGPLGFFDYTLGDRRRTPGPDIGPTGECVGCSVPVGW